jgi:hypothetical protein
MYLRDSEPLQPNKGIAQLEKTVLISAKLFSQPEDLGFVIPV